MLLSSFAIPVSILFIYVFSELTMRMSVKLATMLGVPVAIIGLTVIAFCTSLPEMLVSIISGMENKFDIGISNILGSNNINTCIIYSIFVLFFGNNNQDRPEWVDRVNNSLLCIAFIGVLITLGMLSTDTIVYGFLFAIIVGSLVCWKYFQNKNKEYDMKVNPIGRTPSLEVPQVCKLLLYILLSIVMLSIACKVFIVHAEIVATALGMNDVMLGKLVIALGTCLPEIFISIVALLRREMGFIIGDVLGSNVVNIFFGLPLVFIASSANYNVNNSMLALIAFFVVQSVLMFIGVRYIRGNSILFGLVLVMLLTASIII